MLEATASLALSASRRFSRNFVEYQAGWYPDQNILPQMQRILSRLIDGHTWNMIDVGGAALDVEPTFCYRGKCSVLAGTVIVHSLPYVARPAVGSGNYSLT